MEELLYRVNRVLGSLVKPNSEQASRFLNLAVQYDQILQQVIKIDFGDKYDTGTYDWNDWRAEIRNTFSKSLPMDFLATPLLVETMVFGSTAKLREKVQVLEGVYEKKLLKLLLKESLVGKPKLSLIRYLTSANTVHQASHLATYKINTDKDLIHSNTILEWGGGYGCLARMVKQINSNCTYTIFDLPEFCVLQYIYLSSIFGNENVVIIKNTDQISIGKINLLPSNSILNYGCEYSAETFISNWALTESALKYQKLVNELNFFNATNVCIGCKIDENNYLVDGCASLSTVPNQFLQKNNVYLLR